MERRPQARRRRFKLRGDLCEECGYSVIRGFVLSLVYAFFLFLYCLHSQLSLDNDNVGGNLSDTGGNLSDKDLGWRETDALKSVPSLFTKEMLGVIINGMKSDSDNSLSVESIRKKNGSNSWNVGEESEDDNDSNMFYNFGHTWKGEKNRRGKRKVTRANDLMNDTIENISFEKNRRQEIRVTRANDRKFDSIENRRQERRVTRANELTNDGKFEKLAIDRSRSAYYAALGNYTIWENEYHEEKSFEDMLRLMQDQIIMVRVYSTLATMTNNIDLYEELETQLEKLALEEEPTDIERVLDMIRDTGKILGRASVELYDCKMVTNTLRAMLQTAQEELLNTQTYLTFMSQLASKTVTDVIHCLTLRLTLEYYLLPLPMRSFPRKKNLENPKLYHYALFTDNVLAASVVVNSTVMNAKDSSRHVFHLVTDKLNLAAMSMWFILNPPREATIQVQKYEDFAWLNSSYSVVLRQLESDAIKKFYFKTDRSESAKSGSENLKYRYPKYISMLNHIRFYLPEMFPKLEKILFLDDDVVVQKDLARLWSVDLKGKVNGAVETCDVTFHRLHTYLNFSDPHISERFDPEYCAWAYGMNIFDLKEWRKNNITETYHFWQNLNENRTLWKLGTLPPGLITFYNLTQVLKSKWHLLRLGYLENIEAKKIERSAVIHFNGHRKPWTELGISSYQPYWRKYINFDHSYILSCGLFEYKRQV